MDKFNESLVQEHSHFDFLKFIGKSYFTISSVSQIPQNTFKIFSKKSMRLYPPKEVLSVIKFVSLKFLPKILQAVHTG